MGLPLWLSGTESASSAGDTGLIPRLGRSPGEANANTLQYSCLGTFPWTEESGGLQSIGSHRVRRNLTAEHTRIPLS